MTSGSGGDSVYDETRGMSEPQADRFLRDQVWSLAASGRSISAERFFSVSGISGACCRPHRSTPRASASRRWSGRSRSGVYLFSVY